MPTVVPVVRGTVGWRCTVRTLRITAKERFQDRRRNHRGKEGQGDDNGVNAPRENACTLPETCHDNTDLAPWYHAEADNQRGLFAHRECPQSTANQLTENCKDRHHGESANRRATGKLL